jgi:hypothetical protein
MVSRHVNETSVEKLGCNAYPNDVGRQRFVYDVLGASDIIGF